MKFPNIIFILTDDQGAWAMHCAGNTDIVTPNLDYIAKEGARFENFFCASPVCSPARASIMTGLIPSQHGVHDWIRSGNLDKSKLGNLSTDVRFESENKPISYLDGMKTYTDILAENGYNCALSGKWHLGDSMTPQHGFSKWYTLGRGGGPYYNLDTVNKGKVSFEERYITDVITDRALEYMEEARMEETPFYMSVHYTAPHSPWDENEHPKEYIEMYRDCEFNATPNLPLNKNQIKTSTFGEGEERKDLLRGYYAAISAMDVNIGRIIEDLKKNDEWDNTILIFTSDNGMNMGHHGIWGKGNGTFPFNMYDSAIKVPFLIRIPGLTRAGQVIDSMHSHYDIIHTILEVIGVEINSDILLPGKSFLQDIRNENSIEDGHIVIFDEYGSNRLIRTKEWKFVKRYQEGENELYNLLKDPDETINLYDKKEYHQIQELLENSLVKWYDKYALRNAEGIHEKVTGFGQLNLTGTATKEMNNFYEFKGEKYANR